MYIRASSLLIASLAFAGAGRAQDYIESSSGLRTVPTQYPSPVQEVPVLPRQIVGSLPGQMIKPLPGQIVQALPGQLVSTLPGEIAHSLPGQYLSSAGE